jgi:hypothetical protein
LGIQALLIGNLKVLTDPNQGNFPNIPVF